MSEDRGRLAGQDPFDLERFVVAQAGIDQHALEELRAGRKRSHWMWFVFPQVEGLGFSATTRLYAIRSIREGRAYLEHPTLGPRILESTRAVLEHGGLRTANAIFGYPDDAKFRSSMTLFAQLAPAGSLFHKALDHYYEGAADEATLAVLARWDDDQAPK